MCILPSMTQNPWFICYPSLAASRFRLFCFPYAGGGASLFRTWFAGLPPDIEVCAVQLPGREQRILEPAFTDMPQLIDALREVILPYLDKPFAFFGHSMGALICFELAHKLLKDFAPGPQCLFVSGRSAPRLKRARAPIYNLPRAEFLREIALYGGMPEKVINSEELLEVILPTLRADCSITDTYHYTSRQALVCPTSAFYGRDDHWISEQEIRAWQEETSQAFSIRVLEGNHFFLHTSQAALIQCVYHDIKKFTNYPF